MIYTTLSFPAWCWAMHCALSAGAFTLLSPGPIEIEPHEIPAWA